MRDVLPELMEWWEAGETIGVGTVVATFQSAPRPPGRVDAGRPGRHGGRARSPAAASRARSTTWRSRWSSPGSRCCERYGVSDDDAFAVGLTCGGILDVYVEKVSQETFPELGEIAADIEAGRPVALATVIEHPDPAVARPAARRPPGAGAGRLASARSGPTTRCATTRWGCWRPGTTRR